MNFPDEFLANYEPEGRMEYEESTPMDRWPTLPVADILGAGRPERSWDSEPGETQGSCCPVLFQVLLLGWTINGGLS